jgi:LemA protein
MSGNYEPDQDLKDKFLKEYSERQYEIERRQRSRSALKMGAVAGALLLFLILGVSACGTYNSLQAKREKVRYEWSNIEVQLERRANLIPNLVSTVKGYTKHEERVFSEIAQARSRLLSAGTPAEKMAANDQVSAALSRLLVLAENYPDLKASEQFKRLQDELAGTENRISVARRDYNKAALEYNTSLQRFPTILIARALGFERAQEFKAAEGSIQAPKVEF